MIRRTVLIFVLVLLLAGCNLPQNDVAENTPTADVVATEVSRMKTEMPTATLPPTPEPLVATGTLPPPAPSDTPAPVVEPSATATLDPQDPAIALGSPTWKDSLDTTKNFYLYENDNTAIEAGSGSLRLIGRTNIGWIGWSLTYAQSSANFYLEGAFVTGTCSGADLYGLVFRANKENAGYFFGVTCDGRYNLHARDFNNNGDTEILELKSNPAILTGSNQTNRIGVKTEGGRLMLYANGALLEEVNDSAYTSGYFGPFIAGYDTAGFTVDLDQIALWKQD